MCAEKPIICFRQKHFRRITKRSKRQTYPHSIMNCLISKILKKRKQINKSSMHTQKKYTQNKLDKQQKPANTILSHSHITQMMQNFTMQPISFLSQFQEWVPNHPIPHHEFFHQPKALLAPQAFLNLSSRWMSYQPQHWKMKKLALQMEIVQKDGTSLGYEGFGVLG